MQILIVDDSKAMRMIVIRGLRQAGFGDAEFVEAGNGVEALAKIEEEMPDVVLCDWNMPDMTGIELLETLGERGTSVPFGFVTSESTPVMRKRALEAGAMFLLSKPFTPTALEDAITSAVR
jgi:two-component system chemotaxis response regulator CheY